MASRPRRSIGCHRISLHELRRDLWYWFENISCFTRRRLAINVTTTSKFYSEWNGPTAAKRKTLEFQVASVPATVVRVMSCPETLPPSQRRALSSLS